MWTAGPFDVNSPPNLVDFFRRLFTSTDFMPHGHCYFWRPEILWLNVGSDLLITLAYYSIPITLIYFVTKRKDVPFHWVFVMFGLFIFLCGTTHLVEIWTTWHPAYRFQGLVKLITALVSMATAFMLIPIMPKAVSLPGLEPLVRELSAKTEDLTRTNKELERFNRITLGREKRVLELKKEINALNKELGRSEPYDVDGA